MDALHPDLGHGTPVPALEREVEALERDIPDSTDDELMVGVMRIVALVSARGRDGHTGAFVWGTGTYPVHSLPLRLWLFDGRVVVVDALRPYRALVGSRVDSLAGHPTGEVLAALDPLIPRDNEETITLVTPRLLLIPEVLHGLDLIERVGPVRLGVANAAGEREVVDVEPVPMADYNAWAGEYGLHLPARPGPIYLSRPEDPLWFRTLAGGTLYVQYNRVEFIAPGLLDTIRRRARRPDVSRIVLDIRHNYGGETHAFPDVLDVFAAIHTGVDLFVITGRNTFSAASLFAAGIDRRTDAVFVGEPMAGSPNLYGNSREVSLPYSGIAVSVATEYFVGSAPDDLRLTIEPDIPVSLTEADYFDGRDPALSAIPGVSGS